MKGNLVQIAKMLAVLSVLSLVFAGCSAKTGQSPRSFDENWRFVPRVHVEDNSFGVTSGVEFRGCSFDTYYEGYWCPIR